MDTSLRKNIAARDESLAKIRRATRRIAAASAAGSLVFVAGFAHLIPTGLPHASQNGGGGGTSGGAGGTGNGTANGGNGTTGLSHGSGPSQVTSGGS